VFFQTYLFIGFIFYEFDGAGDKSDAGLFIEKKDLLIETSAGNHRPLV
jgi:hypothetical protein